VILIRQHVSTSHGHLAFKHVFYCNDTIYIVQIACHSVTTNRAGNEMSYISCIVKIFINIKGFNNCNLPWKIPLAYGDVWYVCSIH
jgi:hypothetical protein